MRLTHRLCHAAIALLPLVSFDASAIQTTLDLFPSSYEEYDDLILDPEHGFGSPFGGFGRATRSRLAALPLFLPDTDAQEPHDEPFHTQVRDAQGRLFVCRVYHEEELEPSSLTEGMFQPPRARKIAGTTPDLSNADAQRSQEEKNEADKNAAGVAGRLSDSHSEVLDDLVPEKKSKEEWVKEMDKLLKPLEGLCGQVHKGWWSYEWCYKESITQFHVEISKMTSTVQVQDITSLGDFDSRTVVDLEHPDEDDEVTDNFLAQNRPELARVNDKYLHGTICPGTKKERESAVRLVCCSKATVQRRKGLVHRDNVHVQTDIMSIYEVEESKNAICSYNITVCTPLLCKDNDPPPDQWNDFGPGVSSANGGRLKGPRDKPAAPPKDNESIMEILERTLNGFCLQTSTGGWWTYEICHKNNIRQYHEVLGSRKNKNGAIYTSRSIEADHNLGNYQSKFAAIVPEDEHKFVVNATDKKGGAPKPYFELEYVGGDICDHSDVTESAIVAGSTESTQKGIFRASSVRYQCGEIYEISVSEDSTCHYIVWVELPDLCQHPLFKVPTAKKQVFKCLHVPEDDMEQVDDTEESAPTAADQLEGGQS
mmetsp:Transcript_9813/g.27226  ORF Transcript_9813/g.27226 Transcript_9813/m.27226 type:complete len:596 (+) Transcript_9813:71-1858(+)